jgi:integrase
VSTDWKRFKAWCDRRRVNLLRQVTPELLEQFRADVVRDATPEDTESPAPELRRRAQEKARRAFNGCKRRLRPVWSTLIKRKVWSGGNPWQQVEGYGRKATGELLTRFLTLAERDKLLSHLQEHYPRTIYVVACLGYYSGLRRGEILDLRWRDITWPANGQPGRIYCGGKHGRYRDIEVCNTLIEVLRPHRGHPEAFVVYSEVQPPEDPDSIEPRVSLNKTWRGICRRLALLRPDGAPLQLHDLRHSYASHLAQAGVPLLDIQRLLGHAAIQTTLRYAHVDGTRNVVAVLDNLHSTEGC